MTTPNEQSEDVDTRGMYRHMEERDEDALMEGSLRGFERLKKNGKSSTDQTNPATSPADSKMKAEATSQLSESELLERMGKAHAVIRQKKEP